MSTGSMLDPGASCSVSASAGTGKTHALVSRMLRLLLDGADPGGLLAVTYTRRAAAEMGARLNARLARLALADDAAVDNELSAAGLAPDEPLRARARALYESVLHADHPPRMLTLHAFCQDLLNRFAVEAGVTPGFALADGDEPWLDEAWRRLQRRLAREPEAPAARALQVLTALGDSEHVLRETVSEFLQHRGDWWALTEGADDPLAEAVERATDRVGPDAEADPLAPVHGASFNAQLKMLTGLLAQQGAVGSVKSEALSAARDAAGDDRLDRLADALFKQDGEPYQFRPAKSKYSDAQREKAQRDHGIVLEALQRAMAIRRARATRERTVAALTLGACALEVLQAALAQAGLLTFADLEWRACCLLRRAGQAEWLQYRIDRRIDHLLVDEFQDTNPTQWQLLRPLLDELAAGDAGRARSVFLVGDVKQSIYGFRRAQPELMERAAAQVEALWGGGRATLDRSWRSAPAILAFVNRLFCGERERARLGFRDHETARTRDWGRVEVAAAVPAQEKPGPSPAGRLRDPLTQARPGADDGGAAVEGRQVAQRIADLVAAGVPVEAPGGARPMRWGDVLVLARRRRHLGAVEAALTEAGIPFSGAARGTLLDTPEVQDLWALLRWLDAPARDLELAQVLHSPLFGVPMQAVVGLAGSARPTGRWATALASATDPALRAATACLTRWHALARRLPAHDLLDRICDEGGVAVRYESALPAHRRDRIRPNLGALLQLALEADHGRYPSLQGFLRHLESCASLSKEAPDEAPPATGDRVRVMTIHGAKGLEAPAVFLVNAAVPATGGHRRWLVDWPTDAPRPQAMLCGQRRQDRDATSDALGQALQDRESREELNLLYVAVTRARQFLQVSGFLPRQGSKALTWHDRALTAMEGWTAATGDAPLPGLPGDSLAQGSGEVKCRPSAPAPPSAPPDPLWRAPVATAPLPPPDTADPVDAAAARRGTAIHLLLQWRSEGIDAPGILRRQLRGKLGPFRDAEFHDWIEVVRAVRDAPSLRPFFDESRYRRAWNEVPILAAGAGPRDRGVIDRLVDDGDTLWVLDYKSDAGDATVDRHVAQLERYARGVATLWPDRRVVAGVVRTAGAEWVPLVEPPPLS